MARYAFLCGGSALAVAVSLCATGAHADDATASATTATAAAQAKVVSQLTVVAEKREENIETVPEAITAYSGEQRDIIGIKTTQDLSDFTPGLSYYSATDEAVIRGIGRNTVNLATASGVATYFDGVYYGANAAIAEQHDSLFIGNIEVDNGPQNALHGSNSDGGTINYVSQKPTSSFYAEGRAGLANYGYYYGEAVVSGPISDNLRFRLGGNYSTQGGGFNTNLDGRNEGGFGAQGNSGRWDYLEGQLSANVGHLDIWAKASSGDYNTTYHTGNIIGNIPQYEFGEAAGLSPSSYFGLCASNPAGTGCSGQLNTVVAGSAVKAGPVVASQFPGNNPENVNPRDFINTTPDSNQQNNDIALATTWTYHFGGADLQYVGGFQSFDYNLNYNAIEDSGLLSYQLQGAPGYGNLTIFPSGEFTHFDEIDQYYSNELDLLSTGRDRFQYIAGFYQYHEHFNQPVGLDCYPNQPQLKTPLGLTGAAAPSNPLGCEINLDGKISYDDLAGYAHGSYDVSPQWQLTGGLRYTYDHKYGMEAQRLVEFNSAIPGTPNAAADGAFTPAIDITALADGAALASTPPPGAGVASINPTTGFIQRSLDGHWGALTGDATLNWKPDASTLAYFRYARGYKSGGLNSGIFVPMPLTQPEQVDDFELGLKKTWGSTFLLNADGFYYNWANDQQPFPVIVGGTPVPAILAVPKSRIYGFETLAQWRPVDPLVLTLNYAYLDATVLSSMCEADVADPLALQVSAARKAGCGVNTGGQQTFNIAGDALPLSPRNKVSINAQYTLKFEPGALTLSASYDWKQSTWDTIFNEPQDLSPAYSSVNLRAYWEDSKDRYTIIAYADNLFNNLNVDDQALANLGASTGVPFVPAIARGYTAPLTYGLEFQFRWK